MLWITGASTGIGAALAIEAARHGAKVAISARTYEKLEKTKKRCIGTECVNSLVARFARKFLSKFPWPVGRTTAAVQPSKKKIARGTYTKTF